MKSIKDVRELVNSLVREHGGSEAKIILSRMADNDPELLETLANHGVDILKGLIESETATHH